VTVRVGINGFGRIGRNFWRAVQAGGHDIEVVAFNDLGDVATMAHLLKYDSVLGRLHEDVHLTNDGIAVGGTRARCLGVLWASTWCWSPPASSPRRRTPASTSTRVAPRR
jgi:glyceraldehyde-3-phosphate dehydrogenase/erythrose-4-phosphate dehydrogenase